MAIEKIESESFREDVMPEIDDDELDMEIDDDVSETIDLPLTMLNGKSAKEGDVIRLEVVSSNDDSGTVTVKYAEPKQKFDGIKEMAMKFEE